MSATARLEPSPFDPSRELSALAAAAPGDGAIVSFVGLMRGASATGDPLDRLFLEHHPRLTAASLDAISRDALDNFDVTHIRVVHRCGGVAPGEPIVLAAASAPHRRAAFDAADYLMDRLKTDALFWKREDGPAGSRWIEPTDTDRADAARWSQTCPE
ncbi:MAG: molybdenum cofactor biosynthesis protein MoaE [Sphingomicrobium sp.]